MDSQVQYLCARQVMSTSIGEEKLEQLEEETVRLSGRGRRHHQKIIKRASQLLHTHTPTSLADALCSVLIT